MNILYSIVTLLLVLYALPNKSRTPVRVLGVGITGLIVTLLLSHNTQPKKSKAPVCVLGAGITGLTAAVRLQEKGYPVKVFEKTNRIGGKMETFRQNGKVWNMGTGAITDKYDKIFEIINNANIRIIPNGYSNMAAFEPITGLTLPVPDMTNNTKLNAAFERYREIYKKLNVETGYINASPELFVSTGQWLKENDLEDLKQIALAFLTMQGYGAIEETPALYFVYLLGAQHDTKMTIYLVPDGMDQIPLALSKNVDVSLNTEVQEIVRGDDISKMTYKIENGEKLTQDCQSVILAFPPVVNDVAKMIPELTIEEKNILSEISITKYATFANYAPNFKYNAYASVLPPFLPPILDDGRPMAFANQTLGAYTSYHWTRGDYQTPPDESDMDGYEEKLRTIFPNLQPGDEGESALYRKSWTYFPHVNTESLQNGFYKNFDSIQGKQNLYYATPLLGIETIARSIDVAEYIVNKFK